MSISTGWQNSSS